MTNTMANTKFYDPTTAAYFNPKVDRRNVIITGGNSGIGWYTILHLYLHGYNIFILGRNEKKINQAIEEIKVEADKRIEKYTEEEKKSRYLGSFNYIYLDLLDLLTVSKAAEEYASREDKLHILINNAGLLGAPFEITKDGYEILYQVNFVSHFLLTLKLIPQLENFAKEGKVEPRIVNVASLGHNFAYKYFHPSNKLDCFPNMIYNWVRYGNAKGAEIQFSNELARRYKNILSISLHPGIIMNTDLYRYSKNAPITGFFTKKASNVVDACVGVDNEQGATATLRAALDDLTIKDYSGKYLTTGGHEGKTTKIVSNIDNCKTTWSWNLENLNKKGFNLQGYE